MNLYRIMIVDDEEDFRLGVIRKMNWESMGFEVVGDASNGEDALEMAERLNPDVIMTDIKMPFMDGLTLTKRVKNILPGTKIIILSGFDDFDYAKQAIKYDVSEYLLKPIQSSELKEVLDKIKQQIDEELDDKRNMENLHKQYIENLQMIREKYLLNLLEGRISESKAIELSKVYELNLESENYVVGVVVAEKENEKKKNYYESELIAISLREIVEEQMIKCCACHTLIYLDYVIVITLLPNAEKIVDFIHMMNQICSIANRLLGATISSGIGSVRNRIIELSDSYREAKSAIEYKVLLGSDVAIYIEDVEPKRKASVSPDDHYEEKLIHVIKLGEVEDLIATIDLIVKNIKENDLSMQEYRMFLMKLILEIHKLCRTYQLESNDIFGKEFDIYEDLVKFTSLDNLREWLVTVCKKIRVNIRDKRKDSSSMIASKSKTYIDENYTNSELSIEMICEYLGISAAYFSTIFKKETGISCVSYLTQVRMARAIELLNKTDEKTYVIANMIGYQEPNYFSYVFKKYHGISPTKYRANKE